MSPPPNPLSISNNNLFWSCHSLRKIPSKAAQSLPSKSKYPVSHAQGLEWPNLKPPLQPHFLSLLTGGVSTAPNSWHPQTDHISHLWGLAQMSLFQLYFITTAVCWNSFCLWRLALSWMKSVVSLLLLRCTAFKCHFMFSYSTTPRSSSMWWWQV